MTTVRYRIGLSGILLIASFLAWIVWVVISSVNSHYALKFTSPYLVTPVVLVLGVLAGGFLLRRWRCGKLIHLFIVLLGVTAISIPIYANASAAVGTLLIALAGLAVLDLQEVMQPKHLPSGYQRGSALELGVLRQAILVAVIVGVGIWLVLDSQAAIVLTLPVGVLIALLLWKPVAPRQWAPVVLGLLIAAMAGLAVIWLGNRETWPVWLSASESLSSARHTLWSDALRLWATEPLFGSGPGSFTPSSDLASSVPSLSAAHSLVLQVGAELGAIGVILFAVLFLAGLLFAARGSRPVALIAMAAWTALAVHSNIDHLEDFPIVGFMGGVILGWSGLDAHSSPGYRRNENFEGQK